MKTDEIKQKFYTKKWFMWISLILFAPVGILLMWKFQPEINKKTKIILTIVFLVLFFYVIGTNNFNNQTSNKSQNTTQEVTQSEKERQKEQEKIKKQQEKATQKTKSKNIKVDIVFTWESTKDLSHEGIEETKILEVGKDIEEGEYQFQYSYADYDSVSKKSTNKYNRMYFIYIATKKIENINGENINKLEKYIEKSYMFYPDATSDKNITVTLKKGQYVYIQHTAKKQAGDGTIKIKKL